MCWSLVKPVIGLFRKFYFMILHKFWEIFTFSRREYLIYTFTAWKLNQTSVILNLNLTKLRQKCLCKKIQEPWQISIFIFLLMSKLRSAGVAVPAYSGRSSILSCDTFLHAKAFVEHLLCHIASQMPPYRSQVWIRWYGQRTGESLKYASLCGF
jgi:hypothetical protein